VAAAVTLFAWRTGGSFFAEGPDLARHLVVARAVLLVLVAATAYLLPMLWRRSTRLARWAFVGWTGYLGFWLLKQLTPQGPRSRAWASSAACRRGCATSRPTHPS